MMVAFLSFHIFILLLEQTLASTQHNAKRAPDDVLDWVDPLIGSNSGGNVFSGATLPYGMAKG